MCHLAWAYPCLNSSEYSTCKLGHKQSGIIIIMKILITKELALYSFFECQKGTFLNKLSCDIEIIYFCRPLLIVFIGY